MFVSEAESELRHWEHWFHLLHAVWKTTLFSPITPWMNE